jgi:protein ImuA
VNIHRLKQTLEPPLRPVMRLEGQGLSAPFPAGLAAGTHQAAPAAAGDEAAALAFATALTVRALEARPGARALLVQSAEAARESGWAYAAGLQALGLDPDRLAVVGVRSGLEALRTVDEALKSGAVCAVLADLWDEPRLDLSATRRFNLASARTGAMALLVTRNLAGTSAALTRWRVAARPSAAIRRRRLGRPTFSLSLIRNRMGPTGEWTVEWDSHDRVFRAPAPLPLPAARPTADRPAAAGQDQGWAQGTDERAA